MCTSPLHLIRSGVSGYNYSVPCSNCLECRSTLQDAWVFRLTQDLKYLYAHNGKAVFLTFTYNNEHLPYSDFGFKGVRQACFDNINLKSFLNKVKVYMWRKYGKSSYKYFVCEEYGKFTRRPHLHGIFMLGSSVDYLDFCAMCRKLWTFGFMFPRYRCGRYVDNKGKYTSPLLRSWQKAGAYAAKYITKDLDFYGLDAVKSYVESRHLFTPTEVKKYNNCLPKHFQSKGLGSSFLSQINTPQKLLNAINNKVQSAYNLKFVELPRYYVQKLCYYTAKCHNFAGDIFYKPLVRPEYVSCVCAVYEKSLQSKIKQLEKFRLSYHLLSSRLDSDAQRLCGRVFSRYSSEEIVCAGFVHSLSFGNQFIFCNNFNKFNVQNVINFRKFFMLNVYHDVKLDFSPYPEGYFDDIVKYLDIAFGIVNKLRADDNLKRYREFLINRKLKFLSYAT